MLLAWVAFLLLLVAEIATSAQHATAPYFGDFAIAAVVLGALTKLGAT